jgi:hypothetical protein
MKHLFTLLYLFVSIHAFGQASQDKKFRFGLSVNPCLSHRIITNDGAPVSVVNFYKRDEKPTLGYEFSVFSEYFFDVRSKLRIGLGFSKSAFKSSKQNLTPAIPSQDFPEYVRFFDGYRDIVIPILYTRSLKNEASDLYFIGGIEPQIKINRTKKEQQWFSDGRIETDRYEYTFTDFKRFNANIVLGIGYDIKISQKNSLFIQPTIDCNIFNVSSDATINRRIYTLGVTIGTTIN